MHISANILKFTESMKAVNKSPLFFLIFRLKWLKGYHIFTQITHISVSSMTIFRLTYVKTSNKTEEFFFYLDCCIDSMRSCKPLISLLPKLQNSSCQCSNFHFNPFLRNEGFLNTSINRVNQKGRNPFGSFDCIFLRLICSEFQKPNSIKLFNSKNMLILNSQKLFFGMKIGSR